MAAVVALLPVSRADVILARDLIDLFLKAVTVTASNSFIYMHEMVGNSDHIRLMIE